MHAVDVHEATRLYFPRILRAALMLTGNPWDADDLAQETFLVAARRPDKFRGLSSVYTWLYGILLNLERRRRRQRGLHLRKLRTMAEGKDGGPTVPPAETSIEVREWKASLWSVVARLPDGQRQTLVLRFGEGLQYDEIAEAMQCPLGTVKSRIFHGLKTLRRLVGADQNLRECPPFPSEDIDHAV